MLSRDLHIVLTILYEAGASRVPASQIAWTSDMTPALNRALNMQYIVHRDGKSERLFSLTEAGYAAIDRQPPAYMSISRTMRLLFRIGDGSVK
ncbi:hypothetical protein [Neorhizobium alkalisoli]|uniref:hypothetical protein n=1 Tax=Neorhizobium alkalisoli TaxID=528178 RepID=UPI001319F484|nr:hypothetical protein [Neorhizobium alkalisoli]